VKGWLQDIETRVAADMLHIPQLTAGEEKAHDQLDDSTLEVLHHSRYSMSTPWLLQMFRPPRV
jgi:hypothetical protein